MIARGSAAYAATCGHPSPPRDSSASRNESPPQVETPDSAVAGCRTAQRWARRSLLRAAVRRAGPRRPGRRADRTASRSSRSSRPHSVARRQLRSWDKSSSAAPTRPRAEIPLVHRASARFRLAAWSRLIARPAAVSARGASDARHPQQGAGRQIRARPGREGGRALIGPDQPAGPGRTVDEGADDGLSGPTTGVGASYAVVVDFPEGRSGDADDRAAGGAAGARVRHGRRRGATGCHRRYAAPRAGRGSASPLFGQKRHRPLGLGGDGQRRVHARGWPRSPSRRRCAGRGSRRPGGRGRRRRSRASRRWCSRR